MGYVYSADVVAQQLFDPDNYKNPLEGAVLESVMRNTKPSTSIRFPGDSIPESLIAAYSLNYAKKAYKYLEYGRFKHFDSIPTNISTGEDPTRNPDSENYVAPHPDIKALIEAEVGEEVRITWYYFNRVDTNILIRRYLSIDPENVFNAPTRDLGRGNMSAFVERSTGKHYKINHFSHIGSTITLEAEEVVYEYSSDLAFYAWLPNGELKTFTLSLELIDNPPIHPEHLVHQVIWQTVSTRDIGYWFFNESTYDGNPQYDNIYGSIPLIDYGKESFPFAMVIEEGKHVIKEHMGKEYKEQTEALLGTIDLSLEALMDSLSGDPDKPGEGKVDEDVKDAFVTYSVSFDSDQNGTLQYIYEHFREFYENNITKMESAHTHWYNNRNQTDWHRKFVEGGQLMFYNNRVQFAIRYRWISLNVKDGLVTEPFSARPNDEYLNNVLFNDPNIDTDNNGSVSAVWPMGYVDTNYEPVMVGKITKHIFEGQEYAASETTPQSVNDHLYVLRKQLTAGVFNPLTDTFNDTSTWTEPPTYVEMIIMGLAHESRLTNPGGDFGTAGPVQYVVTTIVDINDVTGSADGKFFMPVSVQVLSKFNTIIQSEILYQSLTLVVTLYNETKLPWYADQSLMLAIRIVLMIATWGSSELWMQGFWEIVKQVVANYVIQLLIIKAAEMLVEMIGGESALILAAIAAVVSAFAGSGGNTGIGQLLNADTLMKAATIITDAVKESIEDDYLELQKEIEEEARLNKEREEELDDLLAELGPSYTMDMAKVSVRLELPNFNEKPSDFFNRSVHLTNPGVLSLDAIDSYIGNALTLPVVENNT